MFNDLRPGAFSSAAAGAVSLEQDNAIITEFNNAADSSQGGDNYAAGDVNDHGVATSRSTSTTPTSS